MWCTASRGKTRRGSTTPIKILMVSAEIYNPAAQCHVRVSFETPEYTAAPRSGALLGP